MQIKILMQILNANFLVGQIKNLLMTTYSRDAIISLRRTWNTRGSQVPTHNQEPEEDGEGQIYREDRHSRSQHRGDHYREHHRGEHHRGDRHRGDHRHRGDYHRGDHQRGDHHRGDHHREGGDGPKAESKSIESIQIGTLNVRKLATDDRLLELQAALEKTSLDILAVTELRWTGTGAIDLQDSTYRFYYAGPANKKDVSGTGFLVNKRLQPNVSDFKKINDRISELTIQVGRQKISLVAIYAPASTTKEDDDPYETFLEKLDELKRRPNTIILGDFNAKVGRAREGEDSMGHFGHGERNYRGERLVEFCELRGLRIINTFFKQRRGRMWTWRSPNGVTRNVIDFILAAKESAIIKNVGVVAAFNFNTDHRLIRARLDLTIHQAPKKMQKQQEVGSKRGLDKNIFRYAINHFLPQCAENAYEPLKDVIQGAATIATITTKKKSRISEETKVLLQRRHYLRQLNTPQARIDMVELNKTTRRSFREDIEQHRRRAVERAVQEGRSLKKIAQTTAIGKQRITQLRGDDGRLRTDKAGISETTKHFYEDLYATHVDVSFKPTEDREECPPFLESEVRKALSEMKSGKAPGNDGITVEMLKAAQEELIPRLTEMFNDFLRTGTIDDNLADSSTLLLFKKGDPAMLKNYRPISLLATIDNLLTKIIIDGSRRPSGISKSYQESYISTSRDIWRS